MVEFEFKTLEGGVLATLVGGDGSHRLNLSVDGVEVGKIHFVLYGNRKLTFC